MLTNWRMKPVTVEGGAAALVALEQGQAERRPYPLALGDAHMPLTDGFALAQRIKRIHASREPPS